MGYGYMELLFTMDIYRYTINAFDATTVSDVVCSSSLCIMCVFSRILTHCKKKAHAVWSDAVL